MRSRGINLIILFSAVFIAGGCSQGNNPPDQDIHDIQDDDAVVVEDVAGTDAADTSVTHDIGDDDAVVAVDAADAQADPGPDVADVAVDTFDDVDMDVPVVTGFFTNLTVEDNPYAGLSAVVRFKTTEPAIGSVVVDTVGRDSWIVQSGETLPGVDHTVYVMGLYAETGYRMYPMAQDDGEDKLGDSYGEYTTEAIPANFSAFTNIVSQPDAMAPGYTVFSVHKMDLNNPGAAAGDFDPRLITIDDTGRIVGYTKWTDPDARLLGFTLLSDGTRAMVGSFGFVAIDGKGEVVVDKSLADIGLDGATATEDSFLHHDVILLPNGNYAAIGTKLVPMTSTVLTTDAMIVDQVIEFTPGGTVVSRRPLDAYVDYTEESAHYGNNMWDAFYPGWQTYDNMHANSLAYDASDDSIIVGLHTAGLLVKFKHSNGVLEWIIGADGNVPMNGDGTWFTASHGPFMTSGGNVLVYDNGALLNLVDSKPSRVVEYEIVPDGSGGWSGVNQVWQYRNDFFSHIMGNVQRLANGNTLMCNGFRIPSFENFVLEPSITEVTGGDTPEVVFNIQMATQDMDFSNTKYLIFRAFRVDTLYSWF